MREGALTRTRWRDTDSGIQIRFRENIPSLKVCDIVLGPHIQSEFVQAVRHHYWYQLFIDELPVWGMVGIMMQPEQATDGGAAGGGEQGECACAPARVRAARLTRSTQPSSTPTASSSLPTTKTASSKST